MEKEKIIFIEICLFLIGVMLAGCGTSRNELKEQEETRSIQRICTQKDDLTIVNEDDKLYETKNQMVNKKVNGINEYKVSSKMVGKFIFGYVLMSGDDINKITKEDFKTFVDENIKGKTYNWFTVFFDDGTGVQFAGCNYTAGVYGTVDSSGCVDVPKGYIWLKDGEYIYEHE